MIGREEGVENQSPDRPRMTTTETEMITSTDRECGNDDRPTMMDTETNMTTSNAYEVENGNPLECAVCKRYFKNTRGLKIHQGRICKNKMKKRGSSDRKTRSKSTQDSNHSGLVYATPESESMQVPSTNESSGKKEKILWPSSVEKKKWKEFETAVCQKLKKSRGSTEEKLSTLASTIYDIGQQMFGIKEATGVKKQVGGIDRRQGRLNELRKEKKSLCRRWLQAIPEEKEGLKVLYEDLKKKCRLIQRRIRKNERRRQKKRAREQFLKNPYGVAKKMFTEAKSGRLECTKEELDEHLKKTYTDPKKNDRLPQLRGLKHPPKPKRAFKLNDIAKKEVDDFVKKARAKSAPGKDRVPYKVYKMCNRLRYKLHILLRAAWREKIIPERWCHAEGVYLPKEKDAASIPQFRPISTLNVGGKVFIGILARRTMNYLQANEFINEEVQKAGLPGVPGCIEHVSTIWNAIQKAKKDKTDLSVVWLDLANAYGSVPHSILFKAMEHFHIPECVRLLMKNYYGNFQMRFSTQEFTTDWHALEVGIAAGCTISVIWFILVMEMILMSANFEEEHAQLQSPMKAFMDDVTLLAKNPEDMDDVLERLNGLVEWSRMKFKAKKSRSLTFRSGKQIQRRFKIGGDRIPTVKEEPVKSLGRLYAGNLTDRHEGVLIQKQAEGGLAAIEKSNLSGKFKMWCLQFGLYPRLAWLIRKWLGLPRVLNTAALYRKRGSLQLPVTSITEIYKCGKVRTVMMLRESNNTSISNDPPAVNTARKWSAEAEADDALAALKHRDIMGLTQTNRKGLGFGLFKPFVAMNQKERQDAVVETTKKGETEKRELHLINCAQQGQMVRWEEYAIERKLSWQEVWNWTASRMSFLLKSTYDVLPSPANLVRWKISDDDRCRCGQRGTMKHILSNWVLALKRYEWRHNQVLRLILDALKAKIQAYNDGNLPKSDQGCRRIRFVRPGHGSSITPKKKAEDQRWTGTWESASDLGGERKPFLIPTVLKPDIFIWCDEKKMLELVELTVPHEDNMEAARIRKEIRYEDLVKDCKEAGWKAWHSPIEIGCRGFVGVGFRHWLLKTGFTSREAAKLMTKCQETAEKASHWVWLKRNDETWIEDQ